MRALILFSLRRRFFNPIAISLQVLFMIILILLFNLDHISESLHLDFSAPYPIRVNRETLEELLPLEYWEKQGFILVEETSELSIDFNEDIYEVKGAASITLQAKIYALLLQSHQQKILNESHPSVSDFIMNYNSVPLSFDAPINAMEAIQGNLIFAILTSVYFMILNFIAVNSNEIIQEKTSNVLEFILTSITPFQHFCAKILSGLITVLVQIGLSIGIFGALLISRLNLDQGKGLFLLANKYFNLEGNGINFEMIANVMKFSPNMFLKMSWAFIFLVLGLLILQVMILILSSRVKTIEEAASIQGPFYLGLLAIYYMSLGLNTPQQLSSGFGRILSFIPVSSMLMMGMRILSTNVAYDEMILSFLISFLTMFVIVFYGFRWYRKGLVNE